MTAATATRDTRTADDLVSALASRYDLAGQGEGALAASVVRRLHAHQAASGKSCPRCHTLKALSAFSRDSSRLDGLRKYCRECANSAEKRRVNGQSGPPVALLLIERDSPRTSRSE